MNRCPPANTIRSTPDTRMKYQTSRSNPGIANPVPLTDPLPTTEATETPPRSPLHEAPGRSLHPHIVRGVSACLVLAVGARFIPQRHRTSRLLTLPHAA